MAKKKVGKSDKSQRRRVLPREVARVKTALHDPSTKIDPVTSAILTQGNFVKPNRVGVRQMRDGS